MLRRVLGSAALAALVPAADLAILTLFLNPGLSLRDELAALLVCVFVPYAAVGTAVLALLALLGTTLRWWARPARPLIEGRPWFASLGFLAVAAVTALFWFNLLSYRHSIPLGFLHRLAASAVVLSGALLVMVAVGVDALLFPRRSRAVSAALVVLAPAATLVVPLALRPAAKAPASPVPVATDTVHPARRLILVGIDGLGPEQVRDGVARGHLAEFARLLRRGASGPLATLRPTEGPPIWTTILTGRLPRDHGVKSFATYRLRGSRQAYELLPKGALVGLLERIGLVSTRPVTSGSRKRRALWNALNAFGISTGLVRLWGTYPPERVQGFVLSNYFDLLRDDPARAPGTVYPPDLLPELKARAVSPADVDNTLLAEFVDLSRGASRDSALIRPLVEQALAPDLTYQRAGTVLRAAYDPAFFATYLYGLEVVGHSYYRYAHPEQFGNVSAEEVRCYGRVLDRYARLLAQWVG